MVIVTAEVMATVTVEVTAATVTAIIIGAVVVEMTPRQEEAGGLIATMTSLPLAAPVPEVKAGAFQRLVGLPGGRTGGRPPLPLSL